MKMFVALKCLRMPFSGRVVGSMKGAVNINTSPPTSRVNKTYRGSQPCLR